MAIDPYAPCVCGSGKKFRWCCQPIHGAIERAFEQDSQGQHEAAARILDELVREHPGNPEAWGRKAQLLYAHGKPEEAETALDEAFKLNPGYPFGHLLRGNIRYQEGEIPGALILFRKAADLFDPESRDILAQVYGMIADCELKLARPVAARAALLQAIHCQPASEELRGGLAQVFGDQSRLPLSARREYTLQSPAATLDPARRAAWDAVLGNTESAKLSKLVEAFESLTQSDPNDAPAWFNLGLTRAWLGNNRGAIEALRHFIGLAPEQDAAVEAASLCEVLTCGQGMEDLANIQESRTIFEIRNPQPLPGLLQSLESEKRLVVLDANPEEGFVMTIVLDPGPGLVVSTGAVQDRRFGAYLAIMGGLVRVWSTLPEGHARVVKDVQEKAGVGLSPPRTSVGPPIFSDILCEALTFPVGISDPELLRHHILDQAGKFFADVWAQRPMRSLDGATPAEAANDPAKRTRLLGLIRFLEECASGTSLEGYSFDQLRQKLGLQPAGESGTPAVSAITGMGAEELASVPVESLDDTQLEQAYQAAIKLGEQDSARRFAESIVARPVNAERPDRFSWYNYLAQRASQEQDLDRALALLGRGQQEDAEHNQGRRDDDYLVRRGQLHVRRGELDTALGLFTQLAERPTTEPKHVGSAVEALLGMRKSKEALALADKGLTLARTRNDRDSEQYFLELSEAARRQGG